MKTKLPYTLEQVHPAEYEAEFKEQYERNTVGNMLFIAMLFAAIWALFQLIAAFTSTADAQDVFYASNVSYTNTVTAPDNADGIAGSFIVSQGQGSESFSIGDIRFVTADSRAQSYAFQFSVQPRQVLTLTTIGNRFTVTDAFWDVQSAPEPMVVCYLLLVILVWLIHLEIQSRRKP